MAAVRPTEPELPPEDVAFDGSLQELVEAALEWEIDPDGEEERARLAYCCQAYRERLREMLAADLKKRL